LNLPILIIDDNCELLDVIAEQLQMDGFVSVTKSNLTSAMESIKKEEFSLILTDFNIGTSSGAPEIIKLAKSLKPNQRIAVMSGADIEDDRRIKYLFDKHPDVLFLQKPFRIETLIKTFAA
jgi:DNA-binding NtrC family response regulator